MPLFGELTPSGSQAAYDIEESAAGVIYVGTAPVGAAQSDTVWEIKRILLNGSGNPTETKWAVGAPSWTTRTGATYA